MTGAEAGTTSSAFQDGNVSAQALPRSVEDSAEHWPRAPRGARELLTALDACGLVPLARAHGDKDAVLRAALDGVPALQLRIPRQMPIRPATAVVVSALERVLCGAANDEPAEARC